MLPSLALVQLDTLSMEQLANNALTNAKLATHPMELALLVLIPSEETAIKIVNASLVSMIQDQLTALLAQLLANPAPMELDAHHAMPLNSEILPAASAHASMDIMNFTMLINPVPAKSAALNALHAQLPQLHAHHAMPQETDTLELILQDVKLAFVNLDTILLLMVHAFNQTAMLIPSALNANKDLNFAFNALPQRTELLSFQKAFVFAWMDSMLIQLTTVSHALRDVFFALQQLTAQAVLLWPLLMELDHVHAHQRLTSLYLLKELVIVLLVDLIAVFVLMPILAQLAYHHSPRLLTTNVFAQPRTSSTQPVNVFHAQLDANHALQQLTAADVLNHLSFKELFVKLTVMMDLLLLDQFAKDAQLDAYNALKTLFASIVLMVFTCITVPATVFVLQEPLEIAHQATGIVFLAILHA